VNRLRTSAALGALIIVLVACGPAASSDSGEPSADESTPASVAASEPQASEGGTLPSAGVVADLEALIPNTVGDLTLQKLSMRGSEFLLGDDPDPATVTFLQELGVSPSDVSVAFGFSQDGSLWMVLFRAAGADSGQLVAGFMEASGASAESPLEWSSATVGGKQVEVASAGASTTYLYANDDILVFLAVADPAAAEEVLGGLP
jgi:hypothetical protein